MPLCLRRPKPGKRCRLSGWTVKAQSGERSPPAYVHCVTKAVHSQLGPAGLDCNRSVSNRHCCGLWCRPGCHAAVHRHDVSDMLVTCWMTVLLHSVACEFPVLSTPFSWHPPWILQTPWPIGVKRQQGQTGHCETAAQLEHLEWAKTGNPVQPW